MTIACGCGCGTEFEKFDSRNRPRIFVKGHNTQRSSYTKQPRNYNIWEVLICDFCKNTFEARKNRHSRFCNKHCRAKWVGQKLATDEIFKSKQREITLRNGNMPPHPKGKDHPRWRGGLTTKNQIERATGAYVAWRRAVLVSDNFTCQLCKTRGDVLTAHHILPWAEVPEARYEVANGLTVCQPCHSDIHGRFVYAARARKKTKSRS